MNSWAERCQTMMGRAAGHEQRGRVLELCARRGEPRTIRLGAPCGGHGAGGQHPVLDRDDLRDHRQAGQQRMVVLGDEAGRDHLIGEGVVDDVGLAAGRRLQLRDRADGKDARAKHRDGGGGGPVGVEGDDLPGAEDRDAGQARCLEPTGQILERCWLGLRRAGPGRFADEGSGRCRGGRSQHLPARRQAAVAEGLSEGRVAHDAHRIASVRRATEACGSCPIRLYIHTAD